MKRLLIICTILLAVQSLTAFNPTSNLSLVDTSFTGESGVTVAAQLGYLEVPENRENLL